jgi:hypothetical protein
MISSITGFERFAVAQDKELKRLQALVNEQAEQIDSLQKTIEALATACEQAAEKEREACAALVEADGRVHEKAPDAVWRKTVAKLIRARGEPNPAFKNYLDDNWAGIV